MRTLIRASLMALVAPLQLTLAQVATSNTDVPVSKVVLFSSGVGYFEHAGTVRGNSATRLQFRTSQINDILKSIMLQDQDGGRVGAISYPSQDPLAKTLKSFQVDITGNPSQADLLNQLRGARVTIQARGTMIAGTILGVEQQQRTNGNGDVTSTVAVLNLLTGAMMRAVELPSITSLSLDDPQLEEELAKALAALVQARDQDKKPVTINFTGTGDRRVRIGYVVETPIWKTSYRLLLNERGTSARLQGWAIVENQTESDWHGVSLNLVSGRPISFMMDLYQPLYSTRPTVRAELAGNVRPQVYEGGTQVRADVDTARMRGMSTRMQLNSVVTTGVAAERLSGPASIADYAASIQSVAQTAKLGELFQYTVGNVTLARQKSAMLPIVTDSVEVERVSIYNAAVLASNPLNGVWFRNTSGKHLLQGPVTVLDGGGYAGDARVDNVPPGQSRLLSYGIDLDMPVNGNSSNFQTSTVVSAKVTRGTMILGRKLASSHSYSADNKSDKSKVLVIEHPVRGGWKLVDTPAPFETTPTHYRFKFTVAAGKVTALVVKEENVLSETLALFPMDVGQLASYSRTGEISKDVRDALGKAIQLKQAMVEMDKQVGLLTHQIGEISTEQLRIRENMKTVEKSGQYYERLLAKLNEQETQIEKLQREKVDLSVRREGVRRELEEFLRELSVG